MNNRDEDFEYLQDDGQEDFSNNFEEPNYGNYDYNDLNNGFSKPSEDIEKVDQIAQPNQLFDKNADNSTFDRFKDKSNGKDAYAKTLDNKNYYNDELAKNRAQQKELQKQLADEKNINKEKQDTLNDKKKNTIEKRNKLNDAKKRNKANSAGENGIANKIKSVKNRRIGIATQKRDYKDAKADEQKAEKDKLDSDKKLDDSKNALKKNKEERKGLLNDKKKAERFKKLHPVQAAKMAIGNVFNKLKKLLVMKILLPFLIILIVFAILVDVIYEAFEVADTAFDAVANAQEKFDNFTNGLGFQNSEEAFYEDLEEQQKAYDNEINVPLLFSTLFYDDIQNNMDPTEVGAEVVTGEESLISFATVFDYVKSKYDESNSHVGKDGLRYSSNKIYRMRMLAKNMVSKSGTKTASISEYWDKVSSRIGDAFLEMIDITDILQMVFAPADFLESVYQILVGDEVFETTDFGNMIHDNKINDVFDFLGAIFEGIFDIESISVDGVTYSSYKYDEEAYWKYLKENYIPRMPEFKKYINSDDENIRKQEIDNIIKGIRDIYEDYKYYFEQEPQNAEVYYDEGVGGIDNVLVRELRKPVDGNFTGFNGRDAFGVYNGRMQNDVVITHANSGINVGDPVYSVAKGKIVGIGRKTGEIEGSSLGEQTLGSFTKYNLTEHELKGLALLCQHEQDSIEGSKAEASLIANKYEYSKSTKSLHEYVKTNTWWRSGSIYLSDENPQPNQEILEAVRDVLVNGNRTLPKYITEHDSLTSGEILWIENNGTRYSDAASIKNRSLYIKDVTKIKTTHHDSSEYYVFYSFPNSSSDPFGYYPSIYNKMKDDNSSSSTTTNKSNWIKIEHTVAVEGATYNFTTIYNGLGTISEGLKVGDYVEKETIIGTVGIVDYLDNTVTSESLMDKIWWALLDAGLSKESAAGVLANASYESGGKQIRANANSIESGHTLDEVLHSQERYGKTWGLGILGWSIVGWKQGLVDYAKYKGVEWNNEDMQVEFLVKTIFATAAPNDTSVPTYDRKYYYDGHVVNGVTYTMKKFMEATTPEEAGKIFYYVYENSGKDTSTERGNLAKTIYNQYKDKTRSSSYTEASLYFEFRDEKYNPINPTNLFIPITNNLLSGNYIWPAESTTVSDIFGNRYEEMQAHRSSYGEGGTVIHKALDISNASGQPYYTICDGIIERVNDSAYHITELNCGKNTKGEEVHIIYEHGDAANGLRKGQSVKSGILLGTSNGWGKSKGPNSYNAHLHFEVYTLDSNGKKVYNNPLMYLYGMAYDGKDDGKMTCNIKHPNGSNISYITASNYASNGLNKEAVNFMYKYSTGAYDQSDIYNQKGNFYN